MPEPTKRPSLVEQTELDETYPDRMDAISRRKDSLKPALEGAEVLRESYDDTVMDSLQDLGEFLDDIAYNPSYIRELPSFLDVVRSIEGKRMNNKTEFHSAVMAVSGKIDNLLEMDLPDDSKKKLEGLQGLLFDTLE